MRPVGWMRKQIKKEQKSQNRKISPPRQGVTKCGVSVTDTKVVTPSKFCSKYFVGFADRQAVKRIFPFFYGSYTLQRATELICDVLQTAQLVCDKLRFQDCKFLINNLRKIFVKIRFCNSWSVASRGHSYWRRFRLVFSYHSGSSVSIALKIASCYTRHVGLTDYNVSRVLYLLSLRFVS